MQFKWDETKNTLNIQKYGIEFKEAEKLFNDGFWMIEDSRFNYKEKRFVGFGYINNRLLCIVYTERKPNIIRVISMRKANKRGEII